MKVSLFEQVPYRYMPEGFENQHNSVVTAPYQVVEPARMTESLFSAYAELMSGARAGFDGICVTEHSQSSYDISPNPTLLASAVSETDERAEREYARHLEAHYRSGLGAIPHTAMAVPGYAEPAAIEGMLRSTGPAGMLSRMKTATYAEIVDSQVAIVGSPATVADQIEAFVREFRIGNLLVMLQNGSMPRDLTEKNISLFAAEVLPRLRPVWDAEGWENHWWPRGRTPCGTRRSRSGTAG